MQGDLVICAGEDAHELQCAIRAVLPNKRPRLHQYRGYRAWKFSRPSVTVILSGIGTGCLEPLLFEVLDYSHLGDNVAKRLILIGTAGYLGRAGFGNLYLVDGAYTVGCAVALEDKDLPVRPNFAGIDMVHLPRAEEITSDYCYSVTPQDEDERKVKAKAMNPGLREGLAKYWRPGRLISMETAQFYHLSSVYGRDGTQFLALRGVANLADQLETVGYYSIQVLTAALKQAIDLLRR